MLNSDSIVPLYEQVSNAIQEKIRKNELKPGDRVGSINELVNEYNISRVTAVSVIEDLVKKGFAVSRQGKGTFVKNGYIGEELMSLRSFKEISREGESSIVKFEEITLPEELADIFEDGDTEGILIYRLQISNGNPIGLISMTLPKTIAAKCNVNAEDLERFSMFDYLENNGLVVTSATQTISADSAEGEIAKILKLPEGSPILHVERTSYDVDGRAVMCSVFYYRSDSYSYTVKLRRVKGSNFDS
jgi:GntR family transcriptional regulator